MFRHLGMWLAGITEVPVRYTLKPCQITNRGGEWGCRKCGMSAYTNEDLVGAGLAIGQGLTAEDVYRAPPLCPKMGEWVEYLTFGGKDWISQDEYDRIINLLAKSRVGARP